MSHHEYHVTPLPAKIAELMEEIADGSSSAALALAEVGTPEVIH